MHFQQLGEIEPGTSIRNYCQFWGWGEDCGTSFPGDTYQRIKDEIRGLGLALKY